MVSITTTVTTEIDLDLETGARWFAHLSDDEQARFFCLVAREAESWDEGGEHQWWHVGNHLATCRCSTEGGRELVRAIVESLESNLSRRVEELRG